MDRLTRRKFLIFSLGAVAAAVTAAAGIGLYEERARQGPPTSTYSTSLNSTVITSESAATSVSSGTTSKYSQNIQSSVRYLTAAFNSQLNLIAQGTTSSPAAVKFYFFNGQQAPSLGYDMTFEPMECWKQAWCAIEFPVDTNDQTGFKVLAALDGLKTSVGWVHNMKDTPLLGIPIGYDFPNNNMSFTPNSQPSYPTINGQEYAIDQAARFELSTMQWIPWNDKPYTNALGWNPSAIDFTLYSALNFALRKRTDLAQQNVDAVAQHISQNSDGSVVIGGSSSRGIFLGIFLYTCNVLQYFPQLPNGIRLSDVESTVWKLQQSDGSISRNYSNFSQMANGDNETTSAAVLPYCSKLIRYVQQTIANSQYNLNSPPPQNFVVNPFKN